MCLEGRLGLCSLGENAYICKQKHKNIRLPSNKSVTDEKNIRTREKRSTQTEATYSENLPNTIKKALTKIREENEENEKNKKLLLPPIKKRPKSNYVFEIKVENEMKKLILKKRDQIQLN